MSEEHNVLVVHFPQSSNAFEALSDMKSQSGVISAAVVERTTEGQIRVAEGYSPEVGTGTAVGGLVGAMVGVLAGPLGVLVGWSSGLLGGAAYDAAEEADTEDGFTVLSKSIPAGSNALMVELKEASHAAADGIAAKLDGQVTRIPAKEVEEEIKAARKAEHHAKAEARKARWESRRSAFTKKVSGLRPPSKSS